MQEVMELYASGSSASSLSLQYGIDKRKILKQAKELNIFRNKELSHRSILFNRNLFDLIDNQDKAYWLGFIFASGYNFNNKLIISVNKSKDYLLNKLCLYIKYPIDKIVKKNNKKQSLEIIISDKHFSNKLYELGLNKSIPTFPTWMTKNLYPIFILGYCAINMHLKNNVLYINGKNNFLLSLKNNFDNLNISTQIKNNLIIDQKQSLLKLNKYLYNKNYSIPELDKFIHNKRSKYSNNILEIENIKLTSSYIKLLSDDNRIELIDKIYDKVKIFTPISLTNEKLSKEFKYITDYNVDISNLEVNNNIATGCSICKHFCSKSFYNSADFGYKSISEQWNDEVSLKKVIKNRLGIGWNNKNDETFNITYQELINGFKQSREAPTVSIFKPTIAKYMCLKYSEPGDTIGDYSCGFGGRLLGAMSCGRKYIGTDPLTTDELNHMIGFFNFKDCIVIKSGSENYRGEENSIDLYWSSPPYWTQEIYSQDKTQAYNNGVEYFYQIYWKKTLENIKFMLKPNKWFGLNIKNQPKMLEMAQYYFGDIKERVALKSSRSPLNRKAGDTKFEYIYMFRNEK